VSKWGDKVAGLVVVEPGISTASFKEWGEGKVSMVLRDNHKHTFSSDLLTFILTVNFSLCFARKSVL